MADLSLLSDPFNMIITGVGGQGNVIASRIIATMMVRKGFFVTIGETFGASQRGGSVMSHLRISKISNWSPQIPKGRAHMVIALEPLEGVRVLKDYGNPEVKLLSNTRKINPVAVICGEARYPSHEEIGDLANKFTSKSWFFHATDEAVRLGNPILGNIIMLGALSETGVLPMETKVFEEVIQVSLPKDKVELNLKAYEIGREMMRNNLVEGGKNE